MRLAFSSDGVRALSALAIGARGVIVEIPGDQPDAAERAERLMALGVTAGAVVTLLQRRPGVVFTCDQTELAVESAIADAVLVRPLENRR